MQTTQVTQLDWQSLVAQHGETALRVYALCASLARKHAALADTCTRLSDKLAEMKPSVQALSRASIARPRDKQAELAYSNASDNYYSVAAVYLDTLDEASVYEQAARRADALLARLVPTLDDEQAAFLASHATYVGRMR